MTELGIQLQNSLLESENDTIVNQNTLLREIASFITRVPVEFINWERSDISRQGNSIDLKIVSQDGNRCDMRFLVDECQISILVGNGDGEFLFGQEITDWGDLRRLRESLTDLFNGRITELLTYCNDTLIGCKYIVPLSGGKEGDTYTFKSKFGFCWFWNSKKERIYNYAPWLTC